MKTINKTYSKLTVVLLAAAILTSCSQKKQEEGSGTDYKHDEEYVLKINDGTIPVDTYIGSVQRNSHLKNDSLELSINYGSPGVRDRVIWGKLVPYDSVWVSGANTATSFEFSKDVEIDGKVLPVGRAAFFTIPGKKQWTLIFNKDVQQHLADQYIQDNDLLRFTVTPDTLLKPVRRLTYNIKQLDGATFEISMLWEKMKISFKAKAAASRSKNKSRHSSGV